MWHRYLRSTKGSSLVVALIIMMILSILGAVILPLTLMGYKTKLADRNSKVSFYLTEAGLDEAYAILGDEVDKAVASANSEVTDYMEVVDEATNKTGLEKDLLKIKQGSFVMNGETLDPDRYDEFVDADGNYINDGIYLLLDYKFKQEYKKYFNNSFSGIKARVENTTGYGALRPNSISIITGSVKKYDEGTEPDEFSLSIESRHGNKISQMGFSLIIPEYNKPFYISSNHISFSNNVLWTKALTAGRDIVVTGSNNVNINGDVYAYGDGSDFSNHGIMAGSGSSQGHLTINGNVASNAYVQTNGPDSTLNVNNGDIFCNSLVETDTASSADNGHIVVNGNVNTLDDIELNGTQSSIVVNGSYYGFNYNSITHNSSSSIVINSSDLTTIGKSNSSYIKIDPAGTEGKKLSVYNGLGTNGYTIDYKSGVFIGGTVYVPLSNNNIYQTGESVSIKGNYRAYLKPIKTSDEDPAKGVVAGTDDYKYRAGNIIFEQIEELYAATRFGDSGKELDNKDKANYFRLAGMQYPDIVKLGGTHKENGTDVNNIIINDIKFTTGAYITGGGIDDKYSAGKFLNGIQKAFDYNKNEYDYYINKLGDPQINAGDFITNNSSYNTSKLDISNWLLTGTMTNSSFNHAERIDNSSSGTANELYVLDNSGHSVAIRGPGYSSGVSGDKNYDFSTEDTEGIIIAKGDVYLAGRLNFKGTIITQGSIYIVDDNPKTFTNDYNFNIDDTNNFVIKKVAEQKKASGSKNAGYYFKTENITANDTSIINYVDSRAGTDDTPEGAYYKYSEVVKVKNWKRVK